MVSLARAVICSWYSLVRVLGAGCAEVNRAERTHRADTVEAAQAEQHAHGNTESDLAGLSLGHHGLAGAVGAVRDKVGCV